MAHCVFWLSVVISVFLFGCFADDAFEDGGVDGGDADAGVYADTECKKNFFLNSQIISR